MLNSRFPGYLPSAEDLPDPDETPVDNELQELIPGLLKSILLMLWEDLMNWLLAIDVCLDGIHLVSGQYTHNLCVRVCRGGFMESTN